MPSNNIRYANYKAREAARARLRAIGAPCAICGRPIDYSLDWYIDPKDGKRKRHPMSFEVDEKVPVSKGGSPIDMENLQAAHRICNQRAGAKDKKRRIVTQQLPQSKEW